MAKKSRSELNQLIIHVAGLPPGKDSENYFSKEQLDTLYIKLVEMKNSIRDLTEQVVTLTERVLENGRSAGAPESEGL